MKPAFPLLSLLLLAPVAHTADATYADFLTTARTQFETKNFGAARASMQSALGVAKTPDEKFGALSRIAKTFDEQKDFVHAREFYAQAAAQPGISAEDKFSALFNVGDELHKDKQLVEAQKSFESLLADPQIPKKLADIVRFNLGQVLVENGQTDRGRALLSQVGDSDAVAYVRAGAWIEVARNLSSLKLWDAARIAADKAIAVPNAPLVLQAYAHLQRIKTFRAQNNLEGASAEEAAFLVEMIAPLGQSTSSPTFGRAVSKPPTLDPKKPADLPVILEHLSSALVVMQGEELMPQDATSLWLHEQIAETYFDMGDISSGITWMNEFLGCFAPDSKVPAAARVGIEQLQSVALWRLAVTYESQGDLQKARLNWQRLVELPDAAPFYKNAAQKKLHALK